MAKPYEPRLAAVYRDEVRAKLKEQFGYTSEMQIPAVDKIVLNMGLGEGVGDKKKVQAAMEELCHVYVTSAVLMARVLTAMVTMPWALKSISCSQKSTMIKLMAYAVWILWCKQAPKMMKKPKHCWPRSRFLSETRTNATS